MLTFIGLPFIVRTVQPVLQDLEVEHEEAAASLGAGRWQTFNRVIFPPSCSALITGFALAFARGVGEYGSVIFIAGNMPAISEIVPLLIVSKLEQFDYAGATVLAVMMLLASFILLLAINLLQSWTRAPWSSCPGRPHPAGDPAVGAQGDAADEWLLTLAALAFLVLFLFLPLLAVFVEVAAPGRRRHLAAMVEPDALSAIKLTLLVAAIAVPLNLVFGVAASWCITKFEFRGKQLPDPHRPAVLGRRSSPPPDHHILSFGLHGRDGPWLKAHDIQIIFALPGIVIATVFVDFPFVARESIPLMQEQGREDEEAAIVLGAGGWQIFRRVTLPNIRWGLLYGVLLCNAARWASSAPSPWSRATSAARQHHAAPCRRPLQRVQLRRRLRRRLAAGPAGPGHPRRQVGPRMALRRRDRRQPPLDPSVPRRRHDIRHRLPRGQMRSVRPASAVLRSLSDRWSCS